MILHFKINVSTKNIFTFLKIYVMQSTKIFNKHVKTFCVKYHFLSLCASVPNQSIRGHPWPCAEFVCVCADLLYTAWSVAWSVQELLTLSPLLTPGLYELVNQLR